jgi:hypothetical protein
MGEDAVRPQIKKTNGFIGDADESRRAPFLCASAAGPSRYNRTFARPLRPRLSFALC